MKKIHQLAIVTLALATLASGAIVHAQATQTPNEIRITIDNRVAKSSISPVIKDGTIWVPLTLLNKVKGVHLTWDNRNKRVLVNTLRGEYKLKIGEAFATKGKERYSLSGAAVIKQNHVMVPLRLVAELSGATVSWDSDKDTVSIQSEKAEKFKRYSYSVKTNQGIVWSPAPERVNFKDSSIYYPTAPYTLYLSNSKSGNQSKKLIELSSGKKDVYQILTSMYGVGDYVIYHTYQVSEGTAQAFKSQAWVMKVNDPKSNKEIETFHRAGGYSYSFGIDVEAGLYVSIYKKPDLDGDYSTHVTVYDLSTGNKKKIDEYDFNDAGFQFKYEGKTHTVSIEPT